MARAYTLRPKLNVDGTLSQDADRTEEQIVKNKILHRIEPPRESLRKIKQNQVKRTTALFEGGDAALMPSSEPKALYPYRPNETKVDYSATKPLHASDTVGYGVKSKLTVAGIKADNQVLPNRPKLHPGYDSKSKPNYPYVPSNDREVDDKPNYPYRPNILLVSENENDALKKTVLNSRGVLSEGSKLKEQKPLESDRRVSALVASKTKLFESTDECDEKPSIPSKHAVKLKSPHNQTQDEDITPTNEHFPNENISLQTAQTKTPKSTVPFYSKVDKSKKKIKTENLRTNPTSAHHVETTGVQTAHGTQVSLGEGPPRKPPRTFAHDEYVKVKKDRIRDNNTSDSNCAHNSSSHPFYEEVKPNGTIRRNPAKKTSHGHNIEKVKTYESVNEEFKDKMLNYESETDKVNTYENVDDLSGDFLRHADRVKTYEKVDDIDKMPKKLPFKPPPPPRPNNLAHMRAARTTSQDSAVPRWCTDAEYHSQAKVQVLKANKETRRKVNAVIVHRGIANPSYHYSRKHECIPIKEVRGNDGSLKRYKSEEFLYADPDTLRARSTYQDPVDAYRGGFRSPRRTAHGIVLDNCDYAMPYNAVNQLQPIRVIEHNIRKTGTMTRLDARRRSKNGPPALEFGHARSSEMVKENISEAYSVLRKPKKVHKTHSSESQMSSTDDDDSETEMDLIEHQKKLEYVTANRDRRLSYKPSSIYASAMLPQQKGTNQLYAYAMIVGLEDKEDNKIYTPTVLYTFPYQNNALTVIASFCFPDAANWRPVSRYQTESYSFVLTGETGERQYGYCRRFLPPGSRDRLPEVCCIISSLQSWNFYNLLLQELEKKRDISLDHAEELLKAAYGRPMPGPGQEVWIKSCTAKSESTRKPHTVCVRRPSDKRFEKVSLSGLLEHLSYENLIRVFSSVLLERRLIFIARHLGTLTTCIHALISLLYPFSWPHTFIPILPSGLLGVVESPTPFVVGVLTSSQEVLVTLELEQVLIIDIDNDCITQSQGDELRIIPKKLQKALLTALQVKDDSVAKQKDALISEAFLRMFIETIGHYTDFINIQQNGEQVFQKDMFVKAVNSKSIRMFLEWFSETQLFEVFIQEKMDLPHIPDALFELRLMEYRDEMERFSPGFKQNVRDAGKKLRNFFVESGEKLKKAFRPNANVYV